MRGGRDIKRRRAGGVDGAEMSDRLDSDSVSDIEGGIEKSNDREMKDGAR